MRKEFFKLVSLLLVFGGVVLLLGTAGASDLGQIGFDEMIIRGRIGVGLTLLGFLCLKMGGFENVEID